MSKLVITRGLPGSGKSTRARAWVLEDADNRAEVNRDAIRDMINGMPLGTTATEKMVTVVSHNSIRDLLKKGIDVVCSDTNLASKYVRELMRIGHSQGAEIEIWDLTDVPLHVCVDRNEHRTDKYPVPRQVIERMYTKYVKGRKYPLDVPSEDSAGKVPDQYMPMFGKPKVVIVDIDGTVAKMNGRSPYDYSRVSEDRANRPVIEVVQALHAAGNQILFVSGRPDINNVRADTEDWIRKYVRVPYAGLLMRPADRLQVNDAVIKRDIFDAQIRESYDVTCVLDDRDRVVRMWREELGLTVLQVAYGDF